MAELSSRLVPSKRLYMQDEVGFSEALLEDLIAGNPAILGLPEKVHVVQRQVSQPTGGKLDLLLEADDSETRYTVELMLGATDPSHIMRCIEYWDVERKRHREFAHVAVLVAESVTSRFQNVIGLFNSVIPLIAIQVSALQVGDQATLDFVTVMNLVESVGSADDSETESREATRADWDTGDTRESLKWAEQCLETMHRFAPTAALTYLQRYVGISVEGRVNNFVTFRPRKGVLRIDAHGIDVVRWRERLAASGVALPPTRMNRLKIDLREGDYSRFNHLLSELFEDCYRSP